MGYRSSTQVTTNVVVTTTTETVVATITGVTTPRPGILVQLTGCYQVTTGANATALTSRWRRGTGITGTVVGEANPVQIAAVAGSTEELTHIVEDTPGEVSGQTYSLTVQQTAATADATVLQAEAFADIAF